MPKNVAQAAMAFAPQAAEGTFEPALETAVGVDSVATSHGLLLGDPNSGQFESGIDWTLGTRRSPKARLGGGFTRPLGDYLGMEARNLSIAIPFCGNRADLSGAPADGEFAPIQGLQALLHGAYLSGADWATGLGRIYQPDPFVIPFCGYVWWNGSRAKFLDARCSFEIRYVAAEIPVLSCVIEPGQIVEAVRADIPATRDYGVQATVSAPAAIETAMTWGPHLATDGGFSELALTANIAIDDIGDSNKETGLVKSTTEIEWGLSGTIYKLDESVGADDPTYEANEVQRISYDDQLVAADGIGISPFQFEVPAQIGGSHESQANEPAKATRVRMPAPETDEEVFAVLGTNGAATISLIGRGEDLGAGPLPNTDIELIFF